VQERILARRLRAIVGLVAEGAPPDQGRDPGEEQHHADDRPQDVGGGGAVADQGSWASCV
jgi:hypothetical protein